MTCPVWPANPTVGQTVLRGTVTYQWTGVVWDSITGPLAPIAIGSTEPRSLEDRFADVINVKDFGAIGDGVFVNTTLLQLAANYANSTGKSLYFPSGWVFKTGTIFIDGGFDIVSDGATILHIYDQSQPSTGQTLAAPAFFLNKQTERVNISGLTFTQDASTFPTLPNNWLSFLAPIIGYRADHIVVENCFFREIVSTRAVLFRGGNYCKVINNHAENCGFSHQLGEESNFYFHDLVSDSSVVYSPIGATVVNNTVRGYSKSQHAFFLSGANQFTMTENRCLEMNDPISVAYYLRVGDLGVTDINGVQQESVYGVCSDNHVSGACLQAYAVTGDAWPGLGTTNFKMDIVASNNTCDVTGEAISLNNARGAIISNNNLKSSKAVIRVARDCNGVKVTDNTLHCTEGTDESSSNNTAVLITGTTVGEINLSNTTLTTGSSTLHAIKNIGNINADLILRGLTLTFNASVGSPTPIFLRTTADTVNLYELRFKNSSVAMSSRPIIDVETSGDVNIDATTVFESGSNSRGLILNCRSLKCNNAVIPSIDLTVTTRAVISGSDIYKASNIATPSLNVTGNGASQMILSDTFIRNEVGARALEVRNVALTKVNNVSITGNHSAPLVLVATSGNMKYWALDVDNSGTGGNTIQENAPATATKES